MKKWLLISALIFLIGCAFGFLAAWADHEDSVSTYADSLPAKNISHIEINPVWEWMIMPPAIPGMMITVARYPWDWMSDEEWDYRWTMTIGNGAAYAFFYWAFLAVRSLVRMIRRSLLSKAPHAR